jgi:hypothetical protein
MKLSVFKLLLLSNTQTSIFAISFLGGLVCANPVRTVVARATTDSVVTQPTPDPCINQSFCSMLRQLSCPDTDVNCACSAVEADSDQCASCYNSVGGSLGNQMLSLIQAEKYACGLEFVLGVDTIPTATADSITFS